MDSGGSKVVSEVSGNYSKWEQQPLVNRGLSICGNAFPASPHKSCSLYQCNYYQCVYTVLKSVRVHFAYGRIALTLELLGRFGRFLDEDDRHSPPVLLVPFSRLLGL